MDTLCSRQQKRGTPEVRDASPSHTPTDINDTLGQANQRFQNVLRRMNVIWMAVAFISIAFSIYSALTTHPSYMHDWHGITIIALAIAVLTIYSAGLLTHHRTWPPPLRPALSYWLALYIGIALLSQIDSSFAWTFYCVFGVSFALFQSRRLLVAVSIIFITLCIYQGVFTWPLSGNDIGTIFGEGIGFFAMTAFSMLLQYLIAERYARNSLLEKLTQANTSLEEAHRQLAESAAQEQELAVLRERTRLAREMHDTLGHALVLVSVKLEVAQRLRERDPERCDHELETTKEIVRESMKDLRASIANLRSPALEREPACRAISRYAREMAQRVGLRVTYDIHPDVEQLPEQIEETLWKVGQEALTNVEKHAHASKVHLHISRQNSSVLMRIQDDGVGFPQELCQLHTDGAMTCTSPQGHYGLSGMLERVESAGGRLYLRPGPTHGTIVEVELPLVEEPLSSIF